jgi:hypothetical protein
MERRGVVDSPDAARDFSLDPADWRAWFDATGTRRYEPAALRRMGPDRGQRQRDRRGRIRELRRGRLGYVQDDDPEGLAAYLLDVERTAIGLSTAMATVSIARRVLAGACASAWIWSGRPLPGDHSNTREGRRGVCFTPDHLAPDQSLAWPSR